MIFEINKSLELHVQFTFRERLALHVEFCWLPEQINTATKGYNACDFMYKFL